MYLYQPVTVSMRHPFSLGVLSQFPRRVCCRALLMATALLSFAPCVATALTCILSLVENPGRGGADAGWLLICLLVDLRDLSWWDLVYLVDWWLILLVVWILGYCFVKVLRFDLCSSTLLIALGLASELRGQSISVDPAEWISESGVYTRFWVWCEELYWPLLGWAVTSMFSGVPLMTWDLMTWLEVCLRCIYTLDFIFNSIHTHTYFSIFEVVLVAVVCSIHIHTYFWYFWGLAWFDCSCKLISWVVWILVCRELVWNEERHKTLTESHKTLLRNKKEIKGRIVAIRETNRLPLLWL